MLAASLLTAGLSLSVLSAKQDSECAQDSHDIREHSDSTETSEGDFAISQFTRNYPTSEGVQSFYEGLSAKGYDEWARRVNFCEPYYIVDEVARLIATKSFAEAGASTAIVETQPPRKLRMLDVGAGTGLIGWKLC